LTRRSSSAGKLSLPPLPEDRMIRMLKAAALPSTLVLALAACTATPATSVPPPMTDPQPPTAAQCNVEPARALVGKQGSAENVEEARRRSGATVARVIKPGMMVTMEYREDRLNVDLDEAGVIRNVRCG